MLVRMLALLLFTSTVIVPSPLADALFGNVQISCRDTLPRDTAIIQFDSQDSSYTLPDDKHLIIWELRAGRQILTVSVEQFVLVETVYVVPNLTRRIALTLIDGKWRMIEEGFADQAGSLVAFDSEDIAGMPGELSDALGPFGLGRAGTSSATWEGMSLDSRAEDRRFFIQNKTGWAVRCTKCGIRSDPVVALWVARPTDHARESRSAAPFGNGQLPRCGIVRK
jgi:hypothetical protein